MAESNVPQAKQQLEQELGPENFKKYLLLLREWFGQRMTKQMFDFEVETFFGENGLKFHNQLIQCILSVSFGKPPVTVSRRPPASVFRSSRLSTASNITTTTTAALSARESTSSVQEESFSENDYIVSPTHGEESFIYPSNTKEFPIQNKDGHWLSDVVEQEPPPDCDWLREVDQTFPATDENVPDRHMKCRFPPWFVDDFQRVHKTNYANDVNVVKNVTHTSAIVKDLVERKPQLKQHFVVPADKKAPYLTSGCSLYGRFLITAWDHSIHNVNPAVVDYAVKAVKENLKEILTAMFKQRRSFRMREKRILHSVGVPYPNPYLRQGHHMYDETYGSDTKKMADVVMQVPTPFPTLEEKERLAALQVASSHSNKPSQFNSAKTTVMDLYNAIQQNPSLIPIHSLRHKLLDTILRKSKGFNGTYNSQYSHDEEDDEITSMSSPTLPLASY